MPASVEISQISEKAHVDLERWAKIVIEKWEYNVAKYNLIYSGALLNSFTSHIAAEANGSKAIIYFAFKYYLRMLEMGTGKYAPIGKPTRRRKYTIFTKTFNAEVYRLSELMAKQFATEGVVTIIKTIQDK